MITLDFAADSRTIAPGIVLVPLHNGLSRVTRPSGEVLGYIETFEASDGARYRAKRISPRLRRFITIGEFWRLDEAVDCFMMS